MKRLELWVRTLAPVVLPKQSGATILTETADSFSGSVLRGTLANAYIKQKKLNRKTAHEDPDFWQFFFGGLRFVDANLVLRDANAAGDAQPGIRSFVFPFSLTKEKITGQVRDDFAPAGDSEGKAFKALNGYGALTGDGRLLSAGGVLRKTIRLHMSRSDPKERKTGKSEDGNVYNYESLDEGQDFLGYIIGEDAVVETFQATFPESIKCTVGRSRRTHYGLCDVCLGKAEKIEPALQADAENRVILYLDTPLLSSADWTGSVKEAVSPILEALGPDFSLDEEDCFAAFDKPRNFVGTWGLHRARRGALAAGSVFAIRKNSPWTEGELTTLGKMIYQGVGDRTEEGFGQLRPWKPIVGDVTLCGTVDAKARPIDEIPESVRVKADKIIKDHLAEAVRLCAYRDAGIVGKELTTSFAGSLEQMVKNVDSDRSRNFDSLVRTDFWQGSVPERLARQVKFGMGTLYDHLLEKKPYTLEAESISEAQRLAKRIGCPMDDERLRMEYWKAFCSHVRKATARGEA